MIKYLKWVISAKVFSWLISFILGIIMMRYIPPREYGLVAMIAPIYAFLSIINSFSSNASIVTKDNLSKDELSSFVWIKLVQSTFIGLAFFLSTSLITSFYGETILEKIIPFFACLLIFNSIREIFEAFLQRNNEFKILSQIYITSVFLSGLLGLFMAIAGSGFYSLLAKDLCNTLLMLVLTIYFSPWKPSLRFKINEVIGHYQYGFGFTLDALINFFSRNLDDILIGRQFGSDELGFYSKGYSLLTMPVTLVGKSFSEVTLPIFTSLKSNKEKITNLYKKNIRAILFIVIPIGIYIFCSVEEIVTLVLGTRWSEIIPFIKLFALLSIFQSLGPISGSIYKSLGLSILYFRHNLLNQVITITAIIIGFVLGKNAYHVGLAYVIGNSITFFINQYFISEVLKSSLTKLIKSYVDLLLIGLCSLIIMMFVNQYFIFSNIVTLIVNAILLVITFFGSLYIIDKKDFLKIMDFYHEFIE